MGNTGLPFFQFPGTLLDSCPIQRVLLCLCREKRRKKNKNSLFYFYFFNETALFVMLASVATVLLGV